MGLRGPLREASSIRGIREGAERPAPVEQIPDPPAWLSPEEKKLYRVLVEDAIAANGQVLKVDVVVFGNISRLQLAIQRERHPATVAKLTKAVLPWMQAAGLTASGRARLGVTQVEKKKSVTAKLLEITRRTA